jgi:hypothetical protein
VQRPHRPPPQTSRTFLTNHVAALARSISSPYQRSQVESCSFVILLHHRRRIVHFSVTEHPTAVWTAQQLVEAFPDTAPRWLLRDRDAIYGEAFRQRVADGYFAYYHGSRTHLALANDAPTPRRVQGVTEGDVIGFPGRRRLAPPLRTTRRLT